MLSHGYRSRRKNCAYARAKKLKMDSQIVKDYIEAFDAFVKIEYKDDPFDAFKIAEYRCLCARLRDRMFDLYSKIPQNIKIDRKLPKPTYPYWY